MDNYYLQGTHLTNETFDSPLSPETLAHISSCDFCAGQFADYIEEQGLLTAPRDLQTSILLRSRQFDIQVVTKTNEVSKKLQLFYYSIKVGAAVLGALTLLSLTPAAINSAPVRIENTGPTSTERMYNKAQKITEQINEFPNRILNMEVPFYDKKEK